jgi:hypothetical protein
MQMYGEEGSSGNDNLFLSTLIAIRTYYKFKTYTNI